jgi:hypothetical protein
VARARRKHCHRGHVSRFRFERNRFAPNVQYIAFYFINGVDEHGFIDIGICHADPLRPSGIAPRRATPFPGVARDLEPWASHPLRWSTNCLREKLKTAPQARTQVRRPNLPRVVVRRPIPHGATAIGPFTESAGRAASSRSGDLTLRSARCGSQPRGRAASGVRSTTHRDHSVEMRNRT